MVGMNTPGSPTLRQQAEARFRKDSALSPGEFFALSPEAARDMLHELSVHQVELEMQNEELRESQVSLEALRARYFDLYDLAPVGYCTISVQGQILQANLTAANLLGMVRGALLKQPFARLILKEDQDIYYLYRKQLVDSGESLTCELRMVRQDGTPFWAQLAVTAARDADGAPELRAVLSDIAKRKQAEQKLIESKAHLHQLSIFLQRAREQDRTHFARELHDQLGQNLATLRIDFNGLAKDLGTREVSIIARLAAIDQLINSTVDATRMICEELRPGMLDDLGFESALSSYTKNFTRQFNVPCDLLLDCEDYGLDELLSTAIYRIVQEALTNIARHAHASHAMVALQDRGDDLLLSIADDGRGLPLELLGERKTYGMLGMRERVNMLGGSITVDSAPGRGTHIEVSIPRSGKPI